MPEAERKKMKRRGIGCEAAIKRPSSFMATSLFTERNSKIKSAVSENLEKEDFCDPMPLWAYWSNSPQIRKSEFFVSGFRIPNVFHLAPIFGVSSKRKRKTCVCKGSSSNSSANASLARSCTDLPSRKGKSQVLSSKIKAELVEASLKSHKSFNATSIFQILKIALKSALSKSFRRGSFFNCMPLRAFRNSFANKGRDS